MHYDDVRPLLLQAQDRGMTAVREAVIDDPEDPTSTAVRVLIPDLTDQLVEAGDAGVGCAVTEQLGSATSHAAKYQRAPRRWDSCSARSA